jgi:hypothetical protein
MAPDRVGHGPVYEYLAGDHDRLGVLLERALDRPERIDSADYTSFRAGLLRHIGLEERLLFPPARQIGDAETRATIRRLHQDHALFAAMLVPTPTVELLVQLRDRLAEHNVREERSGGIYEVAESIAGPSVEELASALRAGPEARVAPHYDTELARENIQVLLRALEMG